MSKFNISALSPHQAEIYKPPAITQKLQLNYCPNRVYEAS